MSPLVSLRPLALCASLLLLSVVSSCRSSPAGRQVSPSRDPYLISTAELEASPLDNLYDAVHQLRPSWFSRSTRTSGDQSLMVYLVDQQVGNAGALRRFSTRSVAEVRFLTPTDAQIRFGQINLGRAAIVIEPAREP